MAAVPASSNARKSRSLGGELQEGITNDQKRPSCGSRQPAGKHAVADADCGFGGGRCRHHARSALCLTLPSLANKCDVAAGAPRKRHGPTCQTSPIAIAAGIKGRGTSPTLRPSCHLQAGGRVRHFRGWLSRSPDRWPLARSHAARW